MLNQFVSSHTADLGFFHNRDDLTDEVDDPVKGHHSDDNDDGEDINGSNGSCGFGFQPCFAFTVNGGLGQSGGDAGVAFAAGCLKVVRKNGGLGVGAGQNFMNTVTGRAVGDRGVAGFCF